MSEECPIIPDRPITIRVSENDEDNLIIAASHDTIQSFPDERYDHVRYYDPYADNMKAIWLPQHILEQLCDMGIPRVERDSITETEHELYRTYLAQLAVETTGVEVDPVEEAVSHIDQEWEYLQGEEGWGVA